MVGAAERDLKKIAKREVLRIHDYMVKARVLEDRLIRIYKKGDAFFWIGGPGEEALGVPLGLHVNAGKGFDHDWLHLHYRCTPTLVAMGMDMVHAIRLIMNRSTDQCTGGRNFSNHYAFPEYNVAPVTSPIEIQYSVAIGTAHAQSRCSAKGITIVTGGDAGTAEGDFASALVWSSRKGSELPMYMIVTNNRWGISTNYSGQHGEEFIADRGRAFGIKVQTCNGNDPIESYLKLQEGMEYIRKTGKPVLMEASVSRLFGHSSADGANRREEECSLDTFESRLLKAGYLKEDEIKSIWKKYDEEAKRVEVEVRQEPLPKADSIWQHIYVNSQNADWRGF